MGEEEGDLASLLLGWVGGWMGGWRRKAYKQMRGLYVHADS